MIGTLPLSSNPEDIYTVVILEVVYQVRQLWNTLGFWTIDILDEEGSGICTGIKLVSKSYLMQQYPSIPFDLYINHAVEPDRDNIEDIVCGVYEK